MTSAAVSSGSGSTSGSKSTTSAPGRDQQFPVFGVAEAEGPSGGQRDGHSRAARYRSPGTTARRTHRGGGDRRHGGDIDVFGHQIGHRGHRAFGQRAVLDGGHQTRDAVTAPPIRRPAGWRRAPAPRPVRRPGAAPASCRGDPTRLRITPADPDRGVERREAVQQRGDAVTLTARVDHQHHRGAEQPGDVRGRSLRPGRSRPGRSGRRTGPSRPRRRRCRQSAAAVPVQRTDQRLADQHRVQVAARPARRPVRDSRDR